MCREGLNVEFIPAYNEARVADVRGIGVNRSLGAVLLTAVILMLPKPSRPRITSLSC
jgi:hypothetical protein